MISGELPQAPVANLIGFRITQVGDGSAAMEMETNATHFNPMGTVHGGILCDIADAAMGIAFASLAAEGESFTTLELKINFLKPIWKSKLRADARVVKSGKQIGLVECEIKNEQGSLVAKASSTCMFLKGAEARGR